MQPSQEKQKTTTAKLRKGDEEILSCARKICLGRGRSVTHDYFIAAIQGKGFASQTPFLFRGKEDSCSITQHPILSPRPVKRFLQVFQRISPPKPWIEHSVRKNEVRR